MESRILTPAGFAYRASGGKWVCPPHLALLNKLLVELMARRIRRLLVVMAPRHGKSEFCSKYFPGCYLGTFPDHRIMLASYEADFAAEWGRKAQEVVAEHGPATFGIDIDPNVSAASRWKLRDSQGGMYTAGIGGALSGRGSDLMIIDDPIKNSEEAASEARREMVWDWYRSTARTRLEPDAVMLLVQTRWHDDDLAGRIIKNAETTGEAWTCLKMPALSPTKQVYAEVIRYGKAA